MNDKKYRILRNGNKYYLQKKILGLFWVNMKSPSGYAYSYFDEAAARANIRTLIHEGEKQVVWETGDVL
ncbi:hypothetical protein [Ralstonia phage RSP15]|uniref:hypothetical protein n=1 Tax=Ralstonia phage RSP15 TaxID=1785960 RepID=UPI00074D2AF8|nr:hypothetical protein BH754_gp116 [Ralstonia phage RSP15]BAU40190.1 hypothetical protein [Ralstonia phage RSP15]